MDNTLTIWTEQKAHITIEDEQDSYTAYGILTPGYFECSIENITSNSKQEITEAIIKRIKALIDESNEENTFQIRLVP